MNVKIDGLIERGERIAVALSGGADSVALFFSLCELEAKLGIEVLALNVEHGIRGKESVQDSAFVKELCDSVGKRLLFYKVDALKRAEEKKIGVEAAARELRYECFFDAIERGECDKIATAHHLGDNAESVLLNVFRGSGAKGLRGIGEVAFSGRIIRPMLNVSREQIDAYIARKQLKFVTDCTNLDDGYSRNYLRNKILPLIKARFPDVENSLARLGSLAAEDDDYLYSLAERLVCASEGEARIELKTDVPRPVFSRAILLAMRRAGLVKDFERVHVEAVTALGQSSAGASVNLPQGFVAVRGYGELIIYKDIEAVGFEYSFAEGVYMLPGGELKIDLIDLPQEAKYGKTAYFSQKQAEGELFITKNVPQGAVIRCRKEGDTIRKFGGGSKPLKEYLIDKKVERRKRANLPVCAVGNEIIFIAGLAISADAAIADGEKQVYRIKYKGQGV